MFSTVKDNLKLLKDSHIFQIGNNFITQHLVPDFRRYPPLPCNEDILNRAKLAVDNFDVVLDLIDMQNDSYDLISIKLGESIQNKMRSSYLKTMFNKSKPIDTADEIKQKKLFNEANLCDIEIVKYAR
eukprot:CAMPEP_0114518190 /NCGR_PEP_ID=MMETSP0109-20121206/18307_1 /TAXON_ID=29199 /ORGANISM="Chlorarachnion reptans, Strain CCCM449" /LENGTH=127 /DNA_ID=CAMNT_0001698785 /DNA_START=745 /DNA_END=1124 /DNA_ORIENTATION=+